MKTKEYSSFVQQKVYIMHEAVLNCLDNRGDEEIFMNLQDIVDRCGVVVPEKIYGVINDFMEQYLEPDIYGVIKEKKECISFDFQKYDLLEMKEAELEYCSLEDKEWIKIRRIYEKVAMDYIRPIFTI